MERDRRHPGGQPGRCDSGQVTPGGFSPDGQRVLTFSSDGSARIWDAGTPQPQRARSPSALRSALTSVINGPLNSEYEFAPDPLGALRAISAAAGAAVPVVNVRTGAVLARLPAIPGGGTYLNIAFDAHARVMLVTSSGPGGMRPAELRATDGGALLRRLSGPGSLATSAALSPDGTLAATLDQKDRIAVWDVHSGRRLTVFRGHVGASNGYGRANVDFRFSPDGSLMLSVDEAGRTFVWRVTSGQILNTIKGPAVPRGQYSGMGGAISPDDRLAVAVYSWDDQAHVYRVGHAGPLLTLSGHGGGIDDATFNARQHVAGHRVRRRPDDSGLGHAGAGPRAHAPARAAAAGARDASPVLPGRPVAGHRRVRAVRNRALRGVRRVRSTADPGSPA